MRVVIFGGTGFVGLNLAGTLLARGHYVTLYDRKQLPETAQRSAIAFAGLSISLPRQPTAPQVSATGYSMKKLPATRFRFMR